MRGRSLAKIGLRCGGKMNLGCGEEVKESFPKISNNIIFCLCFFFWEENPIMWLLTWKWVRAIWAWKKGVILECTKPILFSTLTVDSQISYFWDLKIILFANGPPKILFVFVSSTLLLIGMFIIS